MTQNWIHITDMVPDFDVDVLGHSPRGIEIVSLARTVVSAEGKQHYWRNKDYSEPDVTHWMPLPEPPAQIQKI